MMLFLCSPFVSPVNTMRAIYRELRLIHLSRIIAVDGSALDISLKNFADGEVTVDRRVKTTEELLLELPAVSRFQATE